MSSNKIKTSDSTETLDQSNEEQDQIQVIYNMYVLLVNTPKSYGTRFDRS